MDTIATKIMNALKKYHAKFKTRILKTTEEVEANTDSGYLVAAPVVGELIHDLGGLKFGIDGDGNYGYYGADDSLIPFSNGFLEFAGLNYTGGIGVMVITTESIKKLRKFIITSCGESSNAGNCGVFLQFYNTISGNSYLTQTSSTASQINGIQISNEEFDVLSLVKQHYEKYLHIITSATLYGTAHCFSMSIG